MAAVSQLNSEPEVKFRKRLHRLGFRYRLHQKKLPGCPDLILPKYRVAVFVHGCFWHRHSRCKRTTTPAKNHEFWVNKFRDNIARDERNYRKLRDLGWRPLVVWECQI